MVDFSGFPIKGDGPIYLRMVRFFRSGIAAGTITDGEEMPSRRVLSALLGVNPNTVQKAYRILEEEGLIVSRSGARSFASVTPETLERVRRAIEAQELKALVLALKRGGLEKETALRLIGEIWDEPEDAEGGGEA